MAGYRIGLDVGRGVVGFYQLIPGRPEHCIQERTVPAAGVEWRRLKVVVQGAFMEIFLDDTLYIVRHHRAYEEGCFGLHSQGSARFRNVSAVRTVGADADGADWQQECRPRHLFPERFHTQ